MIDPCQPLRHAVVVCIFGFEGELEEPSRDRWQDLPRTPAETAIGPDPLESRIAIAYQPHPKVIVGRGRSRRAKDRSNEVVVEKWGPHGDLCLLQRENRVVVPRSLPEDGKRKWMMLEEPRVCSLRFAHVRKKLGTK